MPWYLFGILGALFDSTYYALLKKFLKGIDQFVLAGGVFLNTSAILAAAALVKGIPPIGPDLFPAVIVTGSVNILAALLYFRSLQITDLSLSIPMISFTPIFLIMTSLLLLGELPSLQGVMGIFLIVSGSYILNITSPTLSLLDPLRNIKGNRGIRYMLLVAFLFSISSNFDKIVVRNSDPIFGSALIFAYVGVIFLAVSIARSRDFFLVFKKNANAFLVAGLMLSLSAIAINVAYTMQIVPYVISLKRMSIIFTVLYGGIAFKEKNFINRLAGVGVMFAGVVLIIVF